MARSVVPCRYQHQCKNEEATLTYLCLLLQVDFDVDVDLGAVSMSSSSLAAKARFLTGRDAPTWDVWIAFLFAAAACCSRMHPVRVHACVFMCFGVRSRDREGF